MDKMDKEISAEEIIQGLIKGSRAIDRMKEEVKIVVKTVFGLIKLPEDCAGFSYSSGDYKWEIDKVDFGNLRAQCWVYLGYAWIRAYSSWDESSFRSGIAQSVHEGLPVFIDVVREKFPEINKSWQFLLQAAEK